MHLVSLSLSLEEYYNFLLTKFFRKPIALCSFVTALFFSPKRWAVITKMSVLKQCVLFFLEVLISVHIHLSQNQQLITEVSSPMLQPIKFAISGLRYACVKRKKKKKIQEKYTSWCEGLEQGYGGLVYISHSMTVLYAA